MKLHGNSYPNWRGWVTLVIIQIFIVFFDFDRFAQLSRKFTNIITVLERCVNRSKSNHSMSRDKSYSPLAVWLKALQPIPTAFMKYLISPRTPITCQDNERTLGLSNLALWIRMSHRSLHSEIFASGFVHKLCYRAVSFPMKKPLVILVETSGNTPKKFSF